MARHMSRKHRRQLTVSAEQWTLGVAGVFFLLGVLIALRTVLA